MNTKSFLALMIMVFLGISVWWMESRFGSEFAMAAVGSLIGAVLILTGLLVGLASTRSILGTVAEFMASNARTDQERMKVYKEQERANVERVKIEKMYHDARIKTEMIDAKRIDKIAHERARMLAGVEEARRADTPTWGVEDDSERGGLMGRVGRAIFGDEEEEW